MNITILLIGLFALALFVLPVFYLYWIQKNKAKQIHKHFMAEALKNGVTISESSTWGSTHCVGVDTRLKKLFVMHSNNDNTEETELIDINEIEKCIVLPIYSNAHGSKANKTVERIDLNIAFKNPKKSNKTLCFFNSREDHTPVEQQALAEKWARIINTHIG